MTSSWPVAHWTSWSDRNTQASTNAAPSDGRAVRRFPEAVEPQSKRPLGPGSGRDNGEAGLSIYARPFVPEVLTVINTLSARAAKFTVQKKAIDFSDYVCRSFGLVTSLLPTIPTPTPDTLTDINNENSISNAKEYEYFFQLHLQDEIQAQQTQNESYSLYGQDITIKPHSPSFQSFQNQGETICLLQVPGIRENNPLVEEDDVVYLRQLVYGQDGSPLLMREWLEERNANAGDRAVPGQRRVFTKDAPAPGWTNVLFAARVFSVSRSNELLVLRVLGLPASSTERIEKFNVQFPYPIERYLPMQYALPNVRQGLSSLREYQKVWSGQENGDTNKLVAPRTELPVHWLQSMLFPTLRDCKMQERLHAGQFRQTFFDEVLN